MCDRSMKTGRQHARYVALPLAHIGLIPGTIFPHVSQRVVKFFGNSILAIYNNTPMFQI